MQWSLCFDEFVEALFGCFVVRSNFFVSRMSGLLSFPSLVSNSSAGGLEFLK